MGLTVVAVRARARRHRVSNGTRRPQTRDADAAQITRPGWCLAGGRALRPILRSAAVPCSPAHSALRRMGRAVRTAVQRPGR
jgi:hypothetical protein